MPAIEPDDSSYDQEGGPTKSFLEHLEDLRWVLMKCVATVAVTFMACLLGSPTLVKVLTHPLKKANIHNSEKIGSLTLVFGTNRIGSFSLDTNNASIFGTNRVLEIAPIQIGTNLVLSLQAAPDQKLPPTVGNGVDLVNLGPASAFMLAFQMAIYGGIALASPFLFYFIGQFVFPALKMKEKKYSYLGLAIGILLFTTGVCFCYFALMPVALNAAVQYSEWMGFHASEWRAEEYVTFVSKFLLGMGLGFELPVVLLVLVKIGVLDYQKLAGFRRYMIVVCLILGAVLTTPEVVTQILMAVPLYFLYEVSIWIAWYWERKERKRNETISI